MGYVNGVNLLPSTGEFTYGTTARQGQRIGGPLAGINYYYNGSPSAETDYSVSIDQLQTVFPACQTVAVVCSWFGSAAAGTDAAAEDASQVRIYPSTTYIGGSFYKWNGSTWVSENWHCSSLTQTSSWLIPISQTGASFDYGGTPSDQSITECIQDLKARGFRVVFYPFILMDSPGKPWRGRITYSPDISSAATAAVNAFLGSAATSQFTQDPTNKTVQYSGSPTDWTYRRMILHYANLCVVAGGVDLFLLGSELRGLETIRGPSWTAAGTTDGSGNAIWDYPFVAGLIQLSDDVRSVFDAAGLTKDTVNFHNLVSYSADWSDWMGYQHTGSNPSNAGQWPHLDQLWAHSNIDLVCFDNYLPISDWTTGSGGLDVLNWSEDAPSGIWPPPSSQMSGLGLTGTPTIYSMAYLKANIEGGEKFNWFYNDSNNLGRGFDPNGTDLQVSLPAGDRLAQARKPYYQNQQILGNKQLRWWWNNLHYAVFPGTGGGWVPQGPQTEWVIQSKPIVFTEYGFPSNDKCTNQPNIFFSAGSTESGTAFWSVWQHADGDNWLPKPDQNLQLLALQAFYEYWFVDGHNATSAAGITMIEPAFCSVWNWDARPFPTFPQLSSVWGDAGSWQTGNWLNGKGPFVMPPVPDQPPGVLMPFVFPSLPGLGWSVHKRPSFSTRVASHVSGREVRAPFYAQGLYEFELTVEGLDSTGVFPGLKANSLQSLMGLFIQCQGQFGTFLYTDVTDNSATCVLSGFGNGTKTAFTLQRAIAGSSESISWATGVSNVYLNGVALPQYVLAEDSSTGQHYASQMLSSWIGAGTTVTLSAYVKASARSGCFLQIFDGAANRQCAFNLSTVAATPETGITASSITAAPNGWYLVSASVNMAFSAVPVFAILLANPPGTASYTGTPGSGIYLASPMYAPGNVAATFLTSLAASGGTLTGPNWTVTQPNTLALANAPLGAPAAAYHLTEDGSTGNHLTQQSVTSQSSGSVITFTTYVQAAERSACRLNFYNGSSNIGCDFNLAAGTAGAPDAGITSASINPVGPGWYQVQITGPMVTAAVPIFSILIENPSSAASYTGTTGSGIYFCGGNWQIGYSGASFLPAFSTTIGATIATASVALPPGVAISTDCTYAFNCRFLDDQEDFEEFMSGLWQVQSLKFRSVKP
jgi:GTA TIM-barrel-like domain/Conserved hypothetical protein 2217 (DUF2460)